MRTDPASPATPDPPWEARTAILFDRSSLCKSRKAILFERSSLCNSRIAILYERSLLCNSRTAIRFERSSLCNSRKAIRLERSSLCNSKTAILYERSLFYFQNNDSKFWLPTACRFSCKTWQMHNRSAHFENSTLQTLGRCAHLAPTIIKNQWLFNHRVIKWCRPIVHLPHSIGHPTASALPWMALEIKSWPKAGL